MNGKIGYSKNTKICTFEKFKEKNLVQTYMGHINFKPIYKTEYKCLLLFYVNISDIPDLALGFFTE